MKAITIIQPYAELIANGTKRVENRTWTTNIRGRVAIHAGKATRYGGRNIYSIAEDYGLTGQRLTLGAIVAVADLTDCVTRNQIDTFAKYARGMRTGLRWLIAHEHAEGPCCFVLDNIVRLPNPIPMAGQQQFWDVDDAVIARAMPKGAGNV